MVPLLALLLLPGALATTSPEVAEGTQAETEELPPATYEGVYITATALGGTAFGVGLRWVPPDSPLALETTLGPRVGIAREVYFNLAATAGASLVYGSKQARLGPFVRAGSTLPMGHWYEAFAAGGLETRFTVRKGLWAGFDVGYGLMLVQDLPDDTDTVPHIAYLRFAMDMPVKP